jgi:predicted negative regulator of RcsB-dependent stress response
VDELLSEKEQIERMRTWWSENGAYVVGGVVLGALILFGFNYYQTAQIEAQVAASALYDDLTDKIVAGDLDAAEAIAQDLAGNHGGSSYAAQSHLAMARLYMDKNRDLDAAESLRALLAMEGHEPFKHVARLRLAKVLLYQDQAEDVLILLEAQGGGAFVARYAEVRGDAYAALGRFNEARSAYQAALLEQLPVVDQALVQLKLLDLPEEDVQAAVPLPGATAPAEEGGEDSE